ncbi:hypothetical protein [Moheibacter stercoris]|uniref:Uncharacterized protein n=1 Tax=Moheibacter stercoris TaxID=1628251 RepID=A0ABV2LSQ8_9FLAO
MNGTKLKLILIRNKFGNGLDKFPQNTQVTVKDETAEWTINTTTLKNEIKKADWTKVSFWQVEIEEADGDKVKYPKENARLKNGEIDSNIIISIFIRVNYYKLNVSLVYLLSAFHLV